MRACFVEPCDAQGAVLGIYITDLDYTLTENPAFAAARGAYQRFKSRGKNVDKASVWRVIGEECDVVAEYVTEELENVR